MPTYTQNDQETFANNAEKQRKNRSQTPAFVIKQRTLGKRTFRPIGRPAQRYPSDSPPSFFFFLFFNPRPASAQSNNHSSPISYPVR